MPDPLARERIAQALHVPSVFTGSPSRYGGPAPLTQRPMTSGGSQGANPVPLNVRLGLQALVRSGYDPRQVQLNQLGYIPTFWEDPHRVARFQLAIKADPSKRPMWMDPKKLDMAYRYFNEANGGKPWQEWKFLNVEDPGRRYLQGLELPPPEEMFPGEVKWVAEQAKAQQDLEDPRGYPYTVYPHFDELSWQQQTLINTMGRPGIVGALATGAAMGAPAFAAGPGAGLWAMGKGAAFMGLGYAAQNTPDFHLAGMNVGGAVRTGATKGFELLNWMADRVEMALGTEGQIINAIQDPERYGTIADLMANPERTFQAGRAYYESLGRTSEAMAPLMAFMFGAKIPTEKGPISWWDATNLSKILSGEKKVEDFGAAYREGVVSDRDAFQFVLGEPTLMPVDSYWGDTLRKTREYLIEHPEIDSYPEFLEMTYKLQSEGVENPELVAITSAMMLDLVGHIAIDPINLSGFAGTRALRQVGKISRNQLLVNAADISGHMRREGVFATLRTYGALARITPEALDGASTLTRLLAGDGPEWSKAGPIGKLFGLTPRAMATENMMVLGDALQVLMDGRNTVEELHPLFEKVATMPDEAATSLGLRFLKSRDGALAVDVAKDLLPKEQALFKVWQDTTGMRLVLNRLARATGQSEAKLLVEIRDGKGDAALAKILEGSRKAAEAGDAEAATVVRMIEQGQLGVAQLDELVDLFVTNNVPWHPEQWKAQLYAAWMDQAEVNMVAKYGVKVDPVVTRIAKVSKAIQSAMVLDYNPWYVVANTVSNMSHMVIDGNFGLNTVAADLAWWDAMGVRPVKLKQAFGGPAGDIDYTLAMDSAVGEHPSVLEAKAASEANAMSDMAKIADGEGRLSGAHKAIGRFRQRFGVGGKLAGRVESASSVNATTTAARRFWAQSWRPGVGFDRMPAYIEQLLGPDLTRAIYSQVSNAKTVGDLEKVLLGRAPVRPNVGMFVDQVAGELGMDPALARDSLAAVGALDFLNERLAGMENPRPDDIAALFNDLDGFVAQKIEEMALEDYQVMHDQAAAQVKGGDWVGLIDTFYSNARSFAEWWTTHSLRWNATWDEVYRVQDPAIRQSLIRAQKLRARAEAHRHNAMELAAVQGMEDGLTSEGFEPPVFGPRGDGSTRTGFTEVVEAQHQARNAFMDTRDKLWDEFFRSEFKNSRERQAAYEQIMARLDTDYEKLMRDDVRMMEDLDTGVVQMVADHLSTDAANELAKVLEIGRDQYAALADGELRIRRLRFRVRGEITGKVIADQIVAAMGPHARFLQAISSWLTELRRRPTALRPEDMRAIQLRLYTEYVNNIKTPAIAQHYETRAEGLAKVRTQLAGEAPETPPVMPEIPPQGPPPLGPEGVPPAAGAEAQALPVNRGDIMGRAQQLIDAGMPRDQAEAQAAQEYMANRRDPAVVMAEMEELTAAAKARFDAADPVNKGLRPAETDWMTPEELARLEALKLELPSAGEEQQAAAGRVAQKRAERMAAGEEAQRVPEPIPPEAPVVREMPPIETSLAAGLDLTSNGLRAKANQAGIPTANMHGDAADFHLLSLANKTLGLEGNAKLSSLDQLDSNQRYAVYRELDNRARVWEAQQAEAATVGMSPHAIKLLDEYDRRPPTLPEIRRAAEASGADPDILRGLTKDDVRDWLQAKREGRPYEKATIMTPDRLYRLDLAGPARGDTTMAQALTVLHRIRAANLGMTYQDYVANYYAAGSHNRWEQLHQQGLWHQWEKNALRIFETTEDVHEAGYMLDDGTMLDFTGRTQGNKYPSGRALDHRDIWQAMDDFEGTGSSNDAMAAFVMATGAMSMSWSRDDAQLSIRVGRRLSGPQRRLVERAVDGAFAKGQQFDMVIDAFVPDGSKEGYGYADIPYLEGVTPENLPEILSIIDRSYPDTMYQPGDSVQTRPVNPTGELLKGSLKVAESVPETDFLFADGTPASLPPGKTHLDALYDILPAEQRLAVAQDMEAFLTASGTMRISHTSDLWGKHWLVVHMGLDPTMEQLAWLHRSISEGQVGVWVDFTLPGKGSVWSEQYDTPSPAVVGEIMAKSQEVYKAHIRLRADTNLLRGRMFQIPNAEGGSLFYSRSVRELSKLAGKQRAIRPGEALNYLKGHGVTKAELAWLLEDYLNGLPQDQAVPVVDLLREATIRDVSDNLHLFMRHAEGSMSARLDAEVTTAIYDTAAKLEALNPTAFVGLLPLESRARHDRFVAFVHDMVAGRMAAPLELAGDIDRLRTMRDLAGVLGAGYGEYAVLNKIDPGRVVGGAYNSAGLYDYAEGLIRVSGGDVIDRDTWIQRAKADLLTIGGNDPALWDVVNTVATYFRSSQTRDLRESGRGALIRWLKTELDPTLHGMVDGLVDPLSQLEAEYAFAVANRGEYRGHFGRDVLMHFRGSKLPRPGGGTGWVLDELQSDLHGAGRELGYRINTMRADEFVEITKLRQRVLDLTEETEKLRDAMHAAEDRVSRGNQYDTGQEYMQLVRAEPGYTEAREAFERQIEVLRQNEARLGSLVSLLPEIGPTIDRMVEPFNPDFIEKMLAVGLIEGGPFSTPSGARVSHWVIRDLNGDVRDIVFDTESAARARAASILTGRPTAMPMQDGYVQNGVITALNYAIKNGVDRFYWTPADVQVERYFGPFIERGDEVVMRWAPSDWRRVPTSSDDDSNAIGWIITRPRGAGRSTEQIVTAEDMATGLPRAVARYIMENPSGGELTGNQFRDLEIPGFRAFYDEKIGGVLGRLAKKYDAATGRETILPQLTKRYEIRVLELPDKTNVERWLIEERPGEPPAEIRDSIEAVFWNEEWLGRTDLDETMRQAVAEAEAEAARLIKGLPQGKPVELYYMDITPEMRQDLLGPHQLMYQRPIVTAEAMQVRLDTVRAESTEWLRQAGLPDDMIQRAMQAAEAGGTPNQELLEIGGRIPGLRLHEWFAKAQELRQAARDVELGGAWGTGVGGETRLYQPGQQPGTLRRLIDAKTNFPDADFWIIRRGTPDQVGKPTREFNPEHIGVKVTATGEVDPRYLFYMMEYVQTRGYYRPQGTTRLVGIKVGDVLDLPIASQTDPAFRQAAKGGVSFDDEGRALIEFYRSRDFATGIHEHGHVWTRQLTKDQRQVVAAEFNQLYGLKIELDEGGRFIGPEEKVTVKGQTYDSHRVAAEEMFARSIERYFYDGIAPTPRLAAVFEAIKGFMLAVYKTVKGSLIDLEITPALRKVMDDLWEANPREVERILSEFDFKRVEAEAPVAPDAVPPPPGPRIVPPVDRPPIMDAYPAGAVVTGSGPDPNRTFEFRYRVMPLADVVSSTLPTGEVNPAYPADLLQPRDRSRAASVMQMQQIGEQLNPDTLLSPSRRIDDGAPIVGADGLMESGNGRTAGLMWARDNVPAKFAEYRQRLVDMAESLGFDRAQVEAVRDPILVRERVSDVNRAEFVQLANVSSSLGMSAAETARADATRLTPDALARFTVGDNETVEQALNATRNAGFIRLFMDHVPPTDRANMLEADGSISRKGIERVVMAMLVATYPGETGMRLARTLFESTDTNVRNLGAGILGSLGKMSQMETAIARGIAPAELTLSEDVPYAVMRISGLRRDGMSLEDYRGQGEMFKGEETPFQRRMVLDLWQVSQAPKKIRTYLNGYAERVLAIPDIRQDAMVVQDIPPKDELWQQVKDGAQERMFQIPNEQAQLPGMDHVPVGLPMSAQLAQGWENMRPMVDLLRQRMTAPDAMPKQLSIADAGGSLGPEELQELRQWAIKTQGNMAGNKLATMRYAEAERDFTLLNYNASRGFDNYAIAVWPYEFWPTRTFAHWAMRMVDKPWLVATYLKLMQAQARNQAPPGFPDRLRGKIRVPVPFLPEWMGGALYVDPYRSWFPPAMFAGQTQQITRAQAEVSQKAEELLNRKAEAGEISRGVALEAINTHQGDAWDDAMAEAKVLTESQMMDPTDLIGTYLSYSMPIEWARQFARGTPERIGPMPATRTIRDVSSLLGANGGRGWNIEAPVRRALNMPQGDQFEEYREDRMLATMAAEGGWNIEELKQAGIAREGPVFQEAQKRVQQIRLAGGFLNPLFYAGFPADIMPQGEAEQRSLGGKWQRALWLHRMGDNTALQGFLDEYPEYELRLQSFEDPEKRLRSFLIDQIWTDYRELGSGNKELVSQQLGSDFQDAFLDKETRNYDAIPLPVLAQWARALGGQAPESPQVPLSRVQLPPPDLNKLTPAQDEEITTYRETRDAKFPNWYALGQRYYSLPPGAQRQRFLATFPEYVDYRAWNNRYKKDHPTVKWFGTHYDLEADGNVLGTIGMAEIISNPILGRQLFGYREGGQQLTTGALEELMRIWDENGKPGQSFQDWLAAVSGVAQ